MMKIKKRLFPAVLLGVVVCGCAIAYSLSATSGDTSTQHLREAEDLKKVPERDCERCFLVVAFDSMMPIPARYAVVTDNVSSERCLALTYPSDGLLRRRPTKDDALRARSGSIQYCRNEYLDEEMAKLKLKNPVTATRAEKIGDVSVTIEKWKAQVLPGGTTQYWTLIRSSQESMLIIDSSPILAETMLGVAKRVETWDGKAAASR